MKEITENEMKFILHILKNPSQELNSRVIGQAIGITPMGSLKIGKRLEKENILLSRMIGKARIYKINLEKEYVLYYVKFILQRELEHSNSYVKTWIAELKKIKNAESILLFGSVLKKGNEANDIDVLILIKKKNLSIVEKQIEEINLLNKKKLHPVFQTIEDLKKNIKKEDKIVLAALKGIFVFGEDKILEVLK